MGDLIKKVLGILFKIILIMVAIYLLKYIFEYFSLNFSLEDLFYYVIVGFGLWVIAEWLRG